MKERDVVAQVALLSAALGSEISGTTTDGARGLFTDYVTRGIGSGEADTSADGQVSLQEFFDWTRPRASRDARRDSREQNPSVVVGNSASSPSTFIVAWGFAKR